MMEEDKEEVPEEVEEEVTGLSEADKAAIARLGGGGDAVMFETLNDEEVKEDEPDESVEPVSEDESGSQEETPEADEETSEAVSAGLEDWFPDVKFKMFSIDSMVTKIANQINTNLLKYVQERIEQLEVRWREEERKAAGNQISIAMDKAAIIELIALKEIISTTIYTTEINLSTTDITDNEETNNIG